MRRLDNKDCDHSPLGDSSFTWSAGRDMRRWWGVMRATLARYISPRARCGVMRAPQGRPRCAVDLPVVRQPDRDKDFVETELRIRTALARLGAQDVLDWARANCTASLVELNKELAAGVAPVDRQNPTNTRGLLKYSTSSTSHCPIPKRPTGWKQPWSSSSLPGPSCFDRLRNQVLHSSAPRGCESAPSSVTINADLATNRPHLINSHWATTQKLRPNRLASPRLRRVV